MIWFPVTREMFEDAKRTMLDRVLYNSLTNGEGNLAGRVGELMYLKIFGGTPDVTNRKYDITATSGYTVDIKTARCDSVPQYHFNANVFATSDHQTSDALYFMRVTNDYTKCYPLGLICRPDYYREAPQHKKGDFDGPNFKYKADGRHIQIGKLKL
jgi:hypothetical protein